MSKILRKLSYLAFPECSNQALQYLMSFVSSSNSHGMTIPGLEGSDIATDVCSEYIYFRSGGKRGGIQKLSAIQELQLLEMIRSCLDNTQQSYRYSLFNIIFGGIPEAHKINLLTKLVSLAVSLGTSSVLDCAALWMQEQGCHNQAVCDLSHKLVEDFCILCIEENPAFQKLPTLSPLFTCNFITAVTTLYPFDGNAFQKPPPLNLLKYIANWVFQDPCLCFESVRLVRIQSNFSCPLSGLVQWCTLGHLVHTSYFKDEECSTIKNILSKLHFGILQSLQLYRTMELNQELFSLGQFISLSKCLMKLKETRNIEDDDDIVNMLKERIGQVIQVAMVSNSLHVNVKELQTIHDILPDNRLLELIMKSQAS